MAGNSVTIDAKLNESGVTAGAKKIKVSLEEIKKADGSLNWSGVKEGEDAAKKSEEGFTVLKGVLSNLATAGIAMAAGAVKDFCAQVVEIGKTFETSMSKVSALSGATGDDLAALEAKARELGASTTFSASQAADALGYMALAGWDTQQMLDGVGSVLTLAQAGEMELAAASDLVTDYLSAFNMEASETARMVDVLAYAQANANTTVDGLGQAFKNCAANANAAGMDVETTSAAIAMMANQGLKGSEAGTALNAVLRDMTAKMEDGAIAIGDQAIAVMDAQGNYRDFADILADVGTATDGMGEAEKAAALQSTFTADSIKGLNLMLNAGADEMSGFRDELYNCAGAGEEMAATMTDNLGGDLAAMGSAFEELSLKVYDGIQEPLRSAVQFVTNSVVPGLTFLMDNLDYVAIAVGGVAAAVAAVNFGKVTSALGAIPKLIGSISGGPVLLVVGAITALAAGAKWAYDNVEPFRRAVDMLGSELSGTFGPILDEVGRAFSSALPAAMGASSDFIKQTVVPAIEALASFIVHRVVPAAAELGDFVMSDVVPALSQMASWFAANVLPALQQFAGFVTGTVVPALGKMFEWLASNVVPVVQALATAFFSDVLPALQQLAAWIAENVVPAIADLCAWFQANVMPAIQAFAGFVLGNVVPALSVLFGWFANNIVPVLGKLVGFVVGKVVPAIMSMAQWFGKQIVPVLQAVFQWFSRNILPVLSSLASFVLGTVVPALSTLFGWFANNIVPVLKTVFAAVGSAAKGFSDFAGTVGNAIGNAKNAVKSGIDAIVGFFRGAKFSWPKIPMPHFSVRPSGWQIGDLLKGSIPTLGVDWYATGGEFNSARIIGVGEAGRETVLPLENPRAMQHVGEAIADAGGMGDASEVVAALRSIETMLPRLFARYCLRTLSVNKREFGRLVSESEGYW